MSTSSDASTTKAAAATATGTATAQPAASSPPPALRASMAWTFMAMMARELRVLRRNFISTFLRVLIQPLLFVFVFSYVIPKIGSAGGAGMFAGGGAGAGQAAGGTSFSTILVPGLVGSSIVMQSMMAVIFPLMMELSWQRSITDRALAPLPIPLIAGQKIIAAALQGLIGGLLVFPMVVFIHAKGQAPSVHIDNWPLFIVVMTAGAVLSAAGGLLLGTIIDPQKTQMLFALVLLPMTMLGCVYYPWEAMDNIRWLQLLILANPMVYVSEGLRAALTPDIPHMATWGYLVPLLAGATALWWWASRTFTRRVLT